MGAERAAGRPLVVFDGRCRTCARSVRFIAARDPAREFDFTPSGSETAHAVLGRFGIDAAAPGSLVLVEGGAAYVKSTGALRITRRLSGPWPLLAVLLWVPRPLRDAVYGVVARLRYRLAPPTDACARLPPDLRARILP